MHVIKHLRMNRAERVFIMHIFPGNVKYIFYKIKSRHITEFHYRISPILTYSLTEKPRNGKIYVVSCIFSLFSRNTVFIKFWETEVYYETQKK